MTNFQKAVPISDWVEWATVARKGTSLVRGKINQIKDPWKRKTQGWRNWLVNGYRPRCLNKFGRPLPWQSSGRPFITDWASWSGETRKAVYSRARYHLMKGWERWAEEGMSSVQKMDSLRTQKKSQRSD